MSVIIPVYNCEEYIDACIESLKAQTLPQVEYIFVNDCSSDHSAQIISERLAELPGALLVNRAQNGGVSAARNTGLSAASAPYISWVDADDIALPDYCESLLTLIEAAQADVAQVAYVITSDMERKVTQPATANIRIMSGRESLAEMFTAEHYAVWGRLYKRELFADASGQTDLFPVGLTCEDRIANVTLLSRAKTVVVSSQIAYLYRENIGSISADGLTRKSFDLLEADEINVKACEQLGAPELVELAKDRAAKGAFSLLVKWYRFGVTDPELDESEALAELRARFIADYPRLMSSALPAAKRMLAWQMRFCPAAVRAEFGAYRGLGKLRHQRGVREALRSTIDSPNTQDAAHE